MGQRFAKPGTEQLVLEFLNNLRILFTVTVA